MVIQTSIGNPCNGFINPAIGLMTIPWELHGSLGPSTFETTTFRISLQKSSLPKHLLPKDPFEKILVNDPPVLPSKASQVILLHSWMIRLQKTISNLPRNYGRDFSPGKQIVVPRLCKSKRLVFSFQKHDHKSTSKSSSQT